MGRARAKIKQSRASRTSKGAGDPSGREIKTFIPNPKQEYGLKVLSHPQVHRVLFDGGARSGKTVIIVRFLVNVCLSLPGAKILIVRKERKAAASSVWMTLRDYLYDFVPSTAAQMYESTLECHFFNRSVIYVDGLDDKERVEKIRGREYLIVYVNEGTETNYASVSILIDRMAQVVRYPGDRDLLYKQMLIIDCNPKHPRHWIYQWCIRDIDPESGKVVPRDYVEPRSGSYINLRFHRVHWSAFDNVENLAPAYLENLKSLPKIRKMRMLHGMWVENEGMVYDEFDESAHVVDDFYIPDDWKRYRGVDFGYRNPFACVWFAFDDDDVCYAYDEHYQTEMLVEDHAKIILKKSGGDIFAATVADWEAEQRANLEKHGVGVTPAINCKNILDGIDKVKARLKVDANGRTGFKVLRRCTNLINEFFAYHWSDVKVERNEDEKPVDSDNHALWCVRAVVDFHDSDITSSIAGLENKGKYDENEQIERHW